VGDPRAEDPAPLVVERSERRRIEKLRVEAWEKEGLDG
jgi:hypothetical protein